jgi:YfiR/HmsC-like
VYLKYLHLFALSLIVIALRLNASPQVISSESSLRVAFVFSIAKFIEWPEPAFTGPIKICAVNSQPETESALAQLNGKLVQGKTLEVVLLSSNQVRANQLNECRLLYQEFGSDIAFSSALPAGTVFIRDRNSTSNLPPSIMLWLGSDGRLNFSVERARVDSAGVKVSSQLLKLAKPPRE